MTVDRAVRGVAGGIVLATLFLGWAVSAWFHWLTALVGARLLLSSITGSCPAGNMLRRIGFQIDP